MTYEEKYITLCLYTGNHLFIWLCEIRPVSYTHLRHAAGSADVGQWPRLLLAGSGLLAGVFYDSLEHRYENILMYCMTVLSAFCIVVLENGRCV